MENTSLTSQYKLWQFKEIASYNKNTTLVMNTETKRLMIKKEMPAEELELHKQLTSLRHKNIVNILDAVSLNGKCVVLEQFISGQTLEEKLQSHTLSEPEAAEIICQICDGLAFIHKHQIVHRDLTPSNVMITDDGIIKIIDFDISRFQKTTSRKDTFILGTEGYAAPEQFGFKQSGPQTDIYALGILLNVMLTNAFPNETLWNGKFKNIILKCIEIDDTKRYPDVTRLKNAIQNKKTSGRNPFEKILCHIPGFRGENQLVSIFSAIGYFLMIVYCIGCYSTYANNADQAFFIAKSQFFLFFIPILFFSNFMHFQNKLPFLRNCNTTLIRILFNVLAAVSLVAGIFMLSSISNFRS